MGHPRRRLKADAEVNPDPKDTAKKIIEVGQAVHSSRHGNPGDTHFRVNYAVTITDSKHGCTTISVTYTPAEAVVSDWLKELQKMGGRGGGGGGDGGGGVVGFCSYQGGGKKNRTSLLSICCGGDSCLLLPLDFPKREDKERIPSCFLRFLEGRGIRIAIGQENMSGIILPEGAESLLSLVKRANISGADQLGERATVEEIALVALEERYHPTPIVLSTGGWSGVLDTKNFYQEVTFAARDAFLTQKIAAAAFKKIGGEASGHHR